MADIEEPDPLLKALGDVAKVEQEQTKEAWTAAISVDDGAALAAITSIPLDVLRPLDEAEQEAVLEDVFGVPANLVELQPVTARSTRRRAPWIAASAATVLAAAAAVLLMVGPDVTSLPAYRLVPITGGEAQVRGPGATTPGERPSYVSGSRIALILRPSTAVAATVQVGSQLVDAAGQKTRVDLVTEPLGRGSLRVTAIVGQQVPDHPGNYQLEFRLYTSSGSNERAPPLTFNYSVEPPDK